EQLVERGAGGLDDLGKRFRGGPARPPVGRLPLRLVEGGGIEPGLPRQAGSRKRVAPRQRVDRRPNPFVREHLRGGLRVDRKKYLDLISRSRPPCPERDPEKWKPVFGKDHARTKG